MRLDEPAWATCEAAWAEWCEARGLDEDDESFALYERWLEDDSWEPEPDDGEAYFPEDIEEPPPGGPF